MFIDWAVLDFVHGVELSLEQHELLSTGRVLVEETIFEFLQSVHNLQEVALLEEEFEILQRCLLYLVLLKRCVITYDRLNGEQKGVLFEVLTKGRALEFLDPKMKNKTVEMVTRSMWA